MPTRQLGKHELRELLWEISCLGSTLASHDDDRLDDADLGLDSLAMIWLLAQLERRTGLRISRWASVSTLRTVNAIHDLLRRCGLSDDHAT